MSFVLVLPLLNTNNCPFCEGTCILTSISIGSAVFAWLTRVLNRPTHRQTVRQTTLNVTSNVIGRIYTMHAMQPKTAFLWAYLLLDFNGANIFPEFHGLEGTNRGSDIIYNKRRGWSRKL